MPPRLSVETNPSLNRAEVLLREAVAKKKLVIILGRCKALYHGRGASRLGWGDRLVIVKPDGAVLVHRPTGYSPVNWQPDSQAITVEVTDEGLMLRSVRGRPREVLEVYFSTFYMVTVAEGLEDVAEFIEYMDEAEIRDYLARHPEEIEPGLRVLRTERPLGPGYVDIFAVDREGRTVIIEVKRVTAGRDAVLQLKGYVDALKKENPGAPLRGILVAPSITKEAKSLLQALGLEYKQIELAKLYKKAEKDKTRRPRGPTLLDFVK